MNDETEEVLSNWIREAMAPDGQLLPPGIEPAKWVAQQFFRWWQESSLTAALDDAKSSAQAVRNELTKLGGINNAELYEAMHELIHLLDALDKISRCVGLPKQDGRTRG